MMTDNVNPDHYQGEIQCIDYLESALTGLEFEGYLRGNVMKYMHRYPNKNNTEDLKKAKWYLERLIYLHDTYVHDRELEVTYKKTPTEVEATLTETERSPIYNR